MEKKKISAKIVADSINSHGDRIISYILTYPRSIHSELMTHRMFSRNAASSRAIPFNKMVKMVEEDPFYPIAWQKDHKGMQGTEYITKETTLNYIKSLWKDAAEDAVQNAKTLHSESTGVISKQICNRLLEPFMWYTVLVTATEYENFFKLRCPQYEIFAGPEDTEEFACRGRSWKDLMKSNNGMAGDFDTDDIVERLQYSKSGAEIHIQQLAEVMWDARNESVPNYLSAGEWHIPFKDKIDGEAFRYFLNQVSQYDKKQDHLLDGALFTWGVDKVQNMITQAKLKIAIARCARLSYMTFDGEIDYEKDIALHDTLLKSRHMSPFEHCARNMTNDEYHLFHKGFPYLKGKGGSQDNGWCNNFKGFIPYRYLVENG